MEPTRTNFLGAVYAAIIAGTLLLLVLSIPFGTYAIFSPHSWTTGWTYQTQLAPISMYIGLLPIPLPLTPLVGVLFIFLTALYALFLTLAAVQGGGFVRALKDSSREGMGALLRNPLSATIMILGSTLLATIILDAIQSLLGISAGGISCVPYQCLVSFTIAPLVEEVGFRFFLIGVPLAIVLILSRPQAGKVLRALWRPSAAWDGVDTASVGGLEVAPLKNLVYFLIILSSALFGYAHVASGAGWGPGKFTEAAMDGVALAYVYVRYGLHASIIFHWVVDFASNAFAFYGQAAYGVPWTSNSVYSLVPAYDIVFLVGIPGLLYFINLLYLRSVAGRKKPSLLAAQ